MNLCFIDLETTGLKPYHHIIDLTMVVTDRYGNEIKRYSSLIKPSQYALENAEPEALKVNNYSEEKWKNAPTKWDVETDVLKILGPDTVIPIGWNIGFDLSFLEQHIYCSHYFYHHPLDLMSMGWVYYCELNDPLIDYQRPSLTNLCDLLGVEIKNAHTSLGDVEMMLECYRRLI